MTGYGIEQESRDGVGFIVLRGEIDVAAAPDLHEVLVAEMASNKRTIIDLEAVSFLDSSGLSVLVTALRRAREQSTEMALCTPSASTARVLALAGLDGVFRIYPSRESAIGAGEGVP